MNKNFNITLGLLAIVFIFLKSTKEMEFISLTAMILITILVIANNPTLKSISLKFLNYLNIDLENEQDENKVEEKKVT